MAAILVPSPHHPVVEPRRRPVLVLVPGGAGARPERHPAAVYRRRQVVALLLATLLVVGLLAGARAVLAPLAQPAPAGTGAVPAAGAATVEVQAGDTLWTIARRLQPEGDIRPLVDRLASASGGGPLLPGDRIPVPN